jgi:hypothetical protein
MAKVELGGMRDAIVLPGNVFNAAAHQVKRLV